METENQIELAALEAIEAAGPTPKPPPVIVTIFDPEGKAQIDWTFDAAGNYILLEEPQTVTPEELDEIVARANDEIHSVKFLAVTYDFGDDDPDPEGGPKWAP